MSDEIVLKIGGSRLLFIKTFCSPRVKSSSFIHAAGPSTYHRILHLASRLNSASAGTVLRVSSLVSLHVLNLMSGIKPPGSLCPNDITIADFELWYEAFTDYVAIIHESADNDMLRKFSWRLAA